MIYDLRYTIYARADGECEIEYRKSLVRHIPQLRLSAIAVCKGMKTHRSLYVLMAVFMLGFGLHAYAASPREDLVHAYVLVKLSNNNYQGHRDAALRELEDAGHALGLDMRSGGTQHERQMRSDDQMAEAGRILRDVRHRLEARDRDRAASHVDRAIRHIDDALRTSRHRY